MKTNTDCIKSWMWLGYSMRSNSSKILWKKLFKERSSTRSIW